MNGLAGADDIRTGLYWASARPEALGSGLLTSRFPRALANCSVRLWCGSCQVGLPT
jgi:hypothetical protein